MGEAKRRTAEHRQIAARIDARMQQLETLNLVDSEIIAAMTGHMADFHRLLQDSTSAAIDALCQEFAGFYRYAKIVETIAAGVSSGRLDVPGGQAYDENRVASAIHQHVLQLEAKGIAGPALLEHMVGHILDLQQLWSTASDESLVRLCKRYPGLYRYGVLMEAAAEAEKKKSNTGYDHLPRLPESVKPSVTQLLSLGAALERGLQAAMDGHGQRDTSIEDALVDTHLQQWTTQLASLPSELQRAGVPEASRALMMAIFGPMAHRIEQLHRQALAQRN